MYIYIYIYTYGVINYIYIFTYIYTCYIRSDITGCRMWLDVAKGITEHDNQHVFKEVCEDVFLPRNTEENIVTESPGNKKDHLTRTFAGKTCDF